MALQSPPDVIGVDSCPDGWFAVRLYGQGEYEVEVFTTFEKIIEHYKNVDLILVDIPIGLPEDKERRACDLEARERLGSPRSATVFPSPTRQAAEQAGKAPKDYEAASKAQQRYAGNKLTKQSFAIAPKIAEADSVLRGRGVHEQPRIWEVHPEVCFWALNGEQAMRWRKKASAKKGFQERIDLLRRFDSRVDAIVEDASGKHLRRAVAWDDIADALAAAVTGYCGYGSLQTLPAKPPTDAKGLPMEMAFWEPSSR